MSLAINRERIITAVYQGKPKAKWRLAQRANGTTQGNAIQPSNLILIKLESYWMRLDLPAGRVTACAAYPMALPPFYFEMHHRGLTRLPRNSSLRIGSESASILHPVFAIINYFILKRATYFTIFLRRLQGIMNLPLLIHVVLCQRSPESNWAIGNARWYVNGGLDGKTWQF